MDYRKNLLTGISLTVASIFYGIQIFKIKPYTGIGATPLDNRATPIFLASVLFLLGALLIIRAVRDYRTAKADGTATKFTHNNLLEIISEGRQVIYSFLVLITYVLFLDPVGFVPSSIIFIYVLALILTPKGKKKYLLLNAIISVVFSVGLYYIFTDGLNVMLPKGIWPF